MIKIEKNKDISSYLTIKVGAKAKFFVIVTTKEELIEAMKFAKKKSLEIFILGGGSNTVITKNLSLLVIKNEIKGKEVKRETKNNVFLEIKSGESWPKLVNHTLDLNLSGLENLASIYGTVGAAPIQNIGAYGAEFKDVFISLVAVDLKTGNERVFTKEDCQLGYRDSVFKNKYKNKYFIYSLIIRLDKQTKLNLSYKALSEALKAAKLKEITAKDVAFVVNKIRTEKLPNPAVLPNAGSFFKNPEIRDSVLKKIQVKYPEVPVFPSSKKGMIKIPAAWLIEQVGLKGRRFKNVGMYEKQALIMINYGGAKGSDVVQMIKRIQGLVKASFAIDLEPEVRLV